MHLDALVAVAAAALAVVASRTVAATNLEEDDGHVCVQDAEAKGSARC